MHVKIYNPSKNAMQSGQAKTQNWVLEYETTSPRSPDSLMGWTSSKDTLNQVTLKFKTLEEAKTFAENKGWSADILPARAPKRRPRNYGDNFKYRPPAE